MKSANSSQSNPAGHLAGQTVLVTRAAEQSGELVQRIEAAGGRAIVHPVIQILPAEDLDALDGSIERVAEFGLIVFASRNGVRYFKERMEEVRAALPSDIQIAAIGSSTAQLIRELWHVEPAVPTAADSRSLAEFLIDEFGDWKILLLRGNRGSDVLDRRLTAESIDFESVVAYRSVDVDTVSPAIVEMLEAGQIDWVTATSSAIGRSAMSLFAEWLAGDWGSKGKPVGRSQARLVSISPTTTAAIESVGGQVSAEATEYNLDGLVAAMKPTS